jgi:formylglycine-generating enzyme required for sulfatase activity
LLDSGSVDRVLLGSDWSAWLDMLIDDPERADTVGDQLLLVLLPEASDPGLFVAKRFAGPVAVVHSDKPVALIGGLDFAGTRPLRVAWGRVATISGDPLRLSGRPALSEPEPDSGLRFVSLCGGSFMMGSPTDEAGRYTDEGPSHPVTVTAFDLARTEVTVAQYRRFKPGWSPADNAGPGQPATRLNWNEATAYCEHYGYRLPTEAEWEYAARGGSDTPWSFGADPRSLGYYAWYSANSGLKMHPAGQKAANPFGLADMHGNAWEWVEDCYDDKAYAQRPLDSPTIVALNATVGCELRVLRGGSAWYGPGVLRSARRFRHLPGSRYWGFGFRCARARRQP